MVFESKKRVFFGACLLLASIIFTWYTKKEKMILVNVLEKEYYDDMHIAGSEHVPFDQIEKRYAQSWKKYDKETVFVFYCSNYACSASGEAALFMQNNGFVHAYAYEGGMTEWFNLHNRDKRYKLVGVGKKSYLTRENRPIESTKKYKTLSAQELRLLLEHYLVKDMSRAA